MNNARAITVIPSSITDQISGVQTVGNRKRVAAYARVSTETEEQLNSYGAQVDYYSRHIQGKNEWEFVEVYTDEGISATSTKNREGFKRMVADALSGKIDLILTKSVSRFARNTVDTLSTVRQLKEKGVEVYFEKENIYTMDSKGELLITIMSSLAQEESRSISENVTWGQRKRFADGKVSLPYKNFLGYEKGEDGLPQIVEKEAVVIRKIYKMFLEGKTPSGIAKRLSELGILTPAGKSKWHSRTIESILSNEKYKGDARLQKTFTTNFLTKKMKINEGEVPQYYVENSHPPIISSEVFEIVQGEFKRRKAIGNYTSAINCFSSRIVCGDCGGFYGSKVWHSSDKYRCTIWQCNHKFKNVEKCQTPHLDEAVIKQVFVEAFNSVLTNKSVILDNYEQIMDQLTDSTDLEKQREKIEADMKKIEILVENLVDKNKSTQMDQSEYKKRYDQYWNEYLNLQEQRTDLNTQIGIQKTKRSRILAYIQTLAERDGILSDFDEELFSAMIENITILSKDQVILKFRDETEVVWPLPQKY